MEALSDKRNSEIPVPDNLSEYLNDAQLHSLKRVEEFGWHLAFIRRPLFQDIVPVVVNDDGGTIKDRRLSDHPNHSLLVTSLKGKKYGGNLSAQREVVLKFMPNKLDDVERYC